jgi:hypothetical protein
MIRRRKMTLLLFAGLLAMALIQAACGGDDDDGSSEDSEATVTAADKTDEEDDDDPTEVPPEEGDEGEGDEATPTEDEEGGDGDEGSATGKNVDACTLLTQEEVNTAMGVEMQVGEPQNLDPVFSCQWTGPALESVGVSVLYGTEDALNTYYDLAEDSEQVEGLGNRAQWSVGILNFIEVQTDEYVLDVVVNSAELEDEQTKTIAIDLAELTLERVP